MGMWNSTRVRVRVLLNKPSICTIRTVFRTCTRVCARVLVGKSSQARYSAWDSDANLTGNRLQG